MVQRDVATIVARTKTFNLVANKIYGMYNYSLTTCPRAYNVAKAYQEYRIAKVDINIKPAFDTFTNGASLAVPTLYGLIDKAGAFPISTVSPDALKQAGARARRFDDKQLTVTFKPAVLLSSDDSGSPPGPAPVNVTAGMVKVSPWLPTSQNAGASAGAWVPNSIDHRGYLFWIDQSNAPANSFVGSIETVIYYEFRRPLFINVGAEPENIYRSVIDLDTMTETVLTEPV